MKDGFISYQEVNLGEINNVLAIYILGILKLVASHVYQESQLRANRPRSNHLNHP